MSRHLDEQTAHLLESGEDFPGSSELVEHLETGCPTCEQFLAGRVPAASSGVLAQTQASSPARRPDFIPKFEDAPDDPAPSARVRSLPVPAVSQPGRDPRAVAMVAAASLLLGVWAGRTVGLPSVESLLAEGQLQQALAVVSTMPEGPERLFYQARCLEADAQRGDAALAYARLAQGDSPYQQAARARLKSLLPLVGCQDDAEPSGPVAQVSLRAPCPVLRAAPVP